MGGDIQVNVEFFCQFFCRLVGECHILGGNMTITIYMLLYGKLQLSH